MSSISRTAALGIVGQILAGLDQAYTGFGDVVDAVTVGAANAKQQLSDFSHFDFNPKFNTRVISVPRAISGAQDLWDEIRNGLIQKFTTIVDDAKNLTDSIKSIPPRIPGEPILQRTALILSFIHATNDEIASLITEVLDFTGMIDDIKQRIESLDDLFLPQGSTKTVGDFHYRKRNA